MSGRPPPPRRERESSRSSSEDPSPRRPLERGRSEYGTGASLGGRYTPEREEAAWSSSDSSAAGAPLPLREEEEEEGATVGFFFAAEEGSSRADGLGLKDSGSIVAGIKQRQSAQGRSFPFRPPACTPVLTQLLVILFSLVPVIAPASLALRRRRSILRRPDQPLPLWPQPRLESLHFIQCDPNPHEPLDNLSTLTLPDGKAECSVR